MCFTISSAVINSFLDRADSPPLSNVHPSTEELALELTSGTSKT